MPRRITLLILLLFYLLISATTISQSVMANPASQDSTLTPTRMPTVTGTPTGVIVTMTREYEQYNVRSGPNSLYDAIGVLLAGQQVPAKGRSAGGDWLLIEYPGVPGGAGWVYSYYVYIPPGSSLPVVEPPPEPTPAVTPTIDPTLASQFIITLVPTRLPTFTPPPPLVIPTLTQENQNSGPVGLPMGFIIVGLGSLGIFLGLVSIVRGR